MEKTKIEEFDNIQHYATQALKSLDSGSLSEVRGMLELIVEKTELITKK